MCCVKQQAPEGHAEDPSTMPNVKSVRPERVEIDSQPLSVKDLRRLVRKAEVEVKEEIIEEEEEDDEEGEEI